jgi:3D (Asp-Asp-Asp) domain-containing protein
VLGYGTELDVIETSGDWSEVKVDGKVGYVCNQYVQEEDPLADMEYLGEWLTTAYAPTGNATASGSWPESGYTIACNSLEMGTEVFIESVGFRTVEDRGPSNMPSAWLDIFMDSTDECILWGEKTLGMWIVK